MQNLCMFARPKRSSTQTPPADSANLTIGSTCICIAMNINPRCPMQSTRATYRKALRKLFLSKTSLNYRMP